MKVRITIVPISTAVLLCVSIFLVIFGFIESRNSRYVYVDIGTGGAWMPAGKETEAVKETYNKVKEARRKFKERNELVPDEIEKAYELLSGPNSEDYRMNATLFFISGGLLFIGTLAFIKARLNISKKKEAMIKGQVEQFVQSTLRGPVCCRARIADAGDFVSALHLQLFRQEGISTGKALELLDQKLVGVCPDCRTHSAVKGLVLLQSYREKKMRGSKILFTGDSDGGERMLGGQCRNQKCACKVILLYWRPNAPNDSTGEVFLDFGKE